jgi:O-antigen ligase
MIMILPLLVVGLGLCGFRAAILAAGVGLVMLAVSLNQIWRALGVLLGVAIPAVALTVLVPSLFKTVLGRFGTIAADRGSDRLDIWGDAIKLFWEHPFIGYGTDNFKVIIGRLYGEDMMPHSVYIGTLVELGVIGLILMLIWFAVLLTKAWNAPDRIWVFPLIAAFMFQAAFLHEFYMSCFWLAIGLVEGSRAPVAQKAGSPTLSMQKF